MMPELGKYADVVLSAYAVSLVLLALLIVLSLRQARRAREELQKIEGRRNGR